MSVYDSNPRLKTKRSWAINTRYEMHTTGKQVEISVRQMHNFHRAINLSLRLSILISRPIVRNSELKYKIYKSWIAVTKG